MKWSRGGIGASLEADLRRLQLLLPFPDEKTIDANRCCAILHVSRPVIDRLRATPLRPGSDEKCIVAYNTMPHAPLRIDYDSLVRFMDYLREKHAIQDRRPPKVFGRHRDEHLLPFPWADTITVEEVADVLGVYRTKVLNRIEAGQFEAYQLTEGSPWRVSRSSLARVIESFKSAPQSARPYGAQKAAPEINL